jgi:hypothetical protein
MGRGVQTSLESRRAIDLDAYRTFRISLSGRLPLSSALVRHDLSAASGPTGRLSSSMGAATRLWRIVRAAPTLVPPQDLMKPRPSGSGQSFFAPQETGALTMRCGCAKAVACLNLAESLCGSCHTEEIILQMLQMLEH